jgi:aromatic ring-cleaving dioxygenase
MREDLNKRNANAVANAPEQSFQSPDHYRCFFEIEWQLDQFSVEKLMEFLTVLEQDVDILIRPRSDRMIGHISVLAVQ